ncbi:hypothetical protein M8J77_019253 [Diaphorina citri]|nr:hypothetical protein M8J77_019253 [Diaphorina citri]
MSVMNKPVEVTLHVNSAINSESDESGHAVMINDELIMTHQLTYVDINLHNANSQMDNDVTPVYLAAQEGHLEVLKFLVLEAGGSLYVRAKDGMAPIHAAAQMGCLSCLKWMVRDQGVDPNLKDGDGATPLHFAASRGHADCVRWLLRYGGKLVPDKFGKSPINDAAENQQMECLSLLVQHGTLPDYHEEAKLHGKLHGCTCRKGESTKCSYADCVNYTPNSEPFYLHPPLSSTKASNSPGLYINPMTNHGHHANDPFYLHNPQDVMYNRVKDLFDSGGNRLQQPCSLSSSSSSSPSPPPPPPQPMTVKVEVHSSSSGAGSEESSDLSERGSRNGDHDYEDIYSLGASDTGPGRKTLRSRSRDSGSHSRSGSVSSTNSNVVVHITATGGPGGVQPCSPALCKLGNTRDEMNTSEESGVSSASPSDLGHSEEEGEKIKHSQTMKHRNQTNNRMLKRVVSDSGVMVPPPPPPLPDDTSASSSGPGSSTEEEQSLDSAATMVEDREQGRTAHSVTATTPVSQNHNNPDSEHGPALINKQKALPFIPPKFPNNGDDSNALIKPSEYLKSICGTKTSTLRRSTSEMNMTSECLKAEQKSDVPPPPPLPPNMVEPAEENAKERQTHQPLATISIQDLNSVQLRRTVAGKTMSVPLNVPGVPANMPFSNQKNDLIAELKMSKDIIGIKKMKVERVKMEEKQEKEIMSEISRQFSVDVFVEKIPEKDNNGVPIPPWKRQMLAKKAAEKAKKELEEQLAREAEEKRLQAIPAWKRQLMQSKKGDEIKTMKQSNMHISIEESKPSVIVLEKHSSGENQNYTEDNNKENSNPKVEPKVESIPEEKEEDCTPIMPWRSQLRKTNSTLNLLE